MLHQQPENVDRDDVRYVVRLYEPQMFSEPAASAQLIDKACLHDQLCVASRKGTTRFGPRH